MSALLSLATLQRLADLTVNSVLWVGGGRRHGGEVVEGGGGGRFERRRYFDISEC